MSKPITISINLSKLNNEYFYEGKSGKYLNLALFANKDGVDEYGNSHFVAQDIPKEARDRGERGPICGNAKVPEGESSGGRSADRGFPKPPVRDYKLGGKKEESDEPFDF